MPKDLAALLVEDGAVPADVVGRALARQQEAGGALDTALLELGALPEDVLASCLARAAELPPAPPAAWEAADPRARRVFPSRVAERHGLAPFALDGRELSLVATYPVDLGLLDEISFMLSLHLTAHVGPEWRVRELIHRIYGSALPPRLAAVAASVQAAAGAPQPGWDSPPPTPEPEALDAGAAAEPGEEPAGGVQARPPPSALSGFGSDGEALEPLAAALAQALESVDFDDLADEEPAPAEGVAADEAPAEEESAPEEPAAPADRSAPPRWNLEDARAAVAAARHRDEVVLAALRYARDFFEFAAMFAVTRDAVAGHDALGVEEDERERARSVAIWASDPGVFKTVIETHSPYLGPVQAGAAGTDAVLQGLGRAPRTVLVYPIALRARPVCILYADNGEAPVSARRLGDLLLFLSTVGPAFERIIRDRKKRRVRRRSAPALRPVEEATSPPEPPPAAEPEAPVTAAPTAAEPPTSQAGAPEQDGEPPLPLLDAVEEVPPPAPADLAPPAFEDAASPESEPAPATETEGELSFANLESEEQARPSSPARPAPTDPGRTAILWPAARAPAAGPTADPWQTVAVADAARGDPGSPSRPPAAESLDALEDRFFTGTEEQPARGAAPVPAPPPGPAEPPPRPAGATERTPGTAPPPEPASPPVAAPARVPPVAPPPDSASLAALADRALDADPDAAAAACAALGNRRRDPAVRQATEKLRRALLSGLSARASRAARAIGALRDVDAIPLLIQVLETSDSETAKSAAEALAAITLQRLGPDARRWLAWWKENRGRGRAEWLFSALTSPERELRVAASLELSHAAPAPVVYTADMPAPEREKAARAWAGWWARSGNVL